jgi:mono/diheme cytochrome c family protein
MGMSKHTWRRTAVAAMAVAAASVSLPVVVSSQTPAAPASNVDAGKRGEAWFYQRCSLCHMGRIVKDDVYEPMGPRLTGVLKNATPEREKAVRTHVQRGSPRMPGFEHSFTPAEFEELRAYMKTL